MNIQELKLKSSEQLITQAEELGIENASTLRKQEILFAILKKLAEKNEQITATGVLEVLQDGFGFLRSPEANYLPGPDDIPGFFTDTIGFLLLLPKIRKAAFFWLKNKVNFVKFSSSGKGGGEKSKFSDIEVTDYKEVEPEEKSPWTNNSKTHKSD